MELFLSFFSLHSGRGSKSESHFINLCELLRLVRLMSPKLNILVIAGGMIMYFSIVLYTLPVYDSFGRTFLCNVSSCIIQESTVLLYAQLETRVFSLGYTLCFSTILAKMWRVYYIFTNPKPKRKVYAYFIHSYYFNLALQAVKDWHLALFVLAAVLIDLFLLGLLTIYKGGRQEAYLVKNNEKPSEERGVSSHCFPLKPCMHLVILSFRLLAILQTTMFTLVTPTSIIFGLGLYLVSRQYFKLPHSFLPLAFEK